MTGLEALKRIRQETCPATYMQDFDKNECCDTIEKSLKALEILKRNVKVAVEYGVEKRDISCALVFYIDNKKTIYVVDEAIKEQNPEHFKELELLKEVLGE